METRSRDHDVHNLLVFGEISGRVLRNYGLISILQQKNSKPLKGRNPQNVYAEKVKMRCAFSYQGSRVALSMPLSIKRRAKSVEKTFAPSAFKRCEL
jgi:hypothetical protein